MIKFVSNQLHSCNIHGLIVLLTNYKLFQMNEQPEKEFQTSSCCGVQRINLCRS